MSPYDNGGRIRKIRVIIASATLFTLAILFTFCRIIIRLRYQTRRLSVDDAFLAFGAVCLCVSFGMLMLDKNLSSIFKLQAVRSVYPDPRLPSIYIYTDVFRPFHMPISIYSVLTHTTIFAVKFSYLFFFKCLIRRVRKLDIYWWIATLITGAGWGLGFVIAFLPCHFFDKTRNASCSRKSNDSRITAWITAIAVPDMITDVLIIAIPIQLLWRVQLKLGQKLALGASLCLSVVMIIAAIVRISAIHSLHHGAIDLSWQVFWLLSEACIAVMMFSLTAFRSFFLAHAPAIGKLPKELPLDFSRRKIKHFWGGRARADSEEMEGLPEIPRATLTGIRSFIYGNTTVSSQDKLEDGEGSSL